MGRIAYETKNQMAYKALREAIVSGKLRPGTRLVIKDIALQLGTSGIPVREAVKRLEAEGLIENTPHIGPRIAGVSVNELSNVLPVRAILESFATGLAAENAGPRLISLLEEVVRDMRSAVESRDPYAYGQLNRRFHLIVYEACGNEFLRKLIVDLWDRTERVRSVFSILPYILPESLKSHEEMLRLLREGARDQVSEFTFQHKMQAFDRLIEWLGSHGVGGEDAEQTVDSGQQAQT